MLELKRHSDVLMVILSVLVQLPLAIFLGHYFDERVFMATGYMVSQGLNPYQPHVITGVFDNPHFTGVLPVIGYPPIWPLLLGLIYRLTFNITPNLFLYNFAIKIPVIASNIGLAFLVKKLMQKSNLPDKTVRFAWIFLLFNPFILLTTVAWGQFDTLLALLCVASIVLLYEGKMEACALTLALSIAIKPVALPLIGLPILFCTINACRRNLRHALVFLSTLFASSFMLFYVLSWALPFAPTELTAHLRMAGGLTIFNLTEIFTGQLTLPVGLELLGWIWLPAVLLGYYAVYRNPPNSLSGLFASAAGLLLIFFLTRTWLSEQNITLLLPFLLILLGYGRISKRTIHLAWIIPLVFMFLNLSVPQLFFLVSPEIMSQLTQLDEYIRFWRLLAKFAVAVAWQVFAWSMVVGLLKNRKTQE